MVQWIIAEVMADHEVDPSDVVTRFRRHSVFGWGTFKCTECRLSWSSQITWVTLDIKEQRIRRRFKQKCKKCGQPQRPWWNVEEFAYMMEFALERYQKLVSGTWKPTNRPIIKSDNAPHKSELCERCGFGIRKCWLIAGSDKEDENIDTTKDDSTIEIKANENDVSDISEKDKSNANGNENDESNVSRNDKSNANGNENDDGKGSRNDKSIANGNENDDCKGSRNDKSIANGNENDDGKGSRNDKSIANGNENDTSKATGNDESNLNENENEKPKSSSLSEDRANEAIESVPVQETLPENQKNLVEASSGTVE